MDVRKGMPSRRLSREESAKRKRIRNRLADSTLDGLGPEIDELIAAAWYGYSYSRKLPRTQKAGSGYADPDYDLATDWLTALNAIRAAQQRHDDIAQQKRVLLIICSARSDQTCPGEMSKTCRLCEIAEVILVKLGLAVDFLDLSHLTSELGRQIHACKSCVSTAMPHFHWPCSCYPDYSLQQTDDWMSEIYPLSVGAHDIMIVTPVNWYQAPTGFKAMIDRLVCANGGNPDSTSTHGKKADEAKATELKGWNFPKHLAGRLSSMVMHGDSVGAEGLRRNLTDWLTDLGLNSAGTFAERDGYIGYMEPYATSHGALDSDDAFQQDVRSAASTVARAIKLRAAEEFKPRTPV